MSETSKPDMVRQGDVLVRRVANRDAVERRLDLRRSGAVSPEAGRVVLAHGEATGHHHSFGPGNRAALFRESGDEGGRYLLVEGDVPAMLEHQEHTALPVAPGLHEVVRQRTYVAGAVQRVAD